MKSNPNGYHAIIKEAIDDALIAQPEYATVCYQYISDGYFEWHAPLSVGIISPFNGALEAEIPPARASLEIGYTSISTTMYHLNLERCLARWPYDSKLIHVFYCTDEWPCLIGNY